MLRSTRQFHVKARLVKTRWDRLEKTPLPAIFPLRDGGFLILGKAGDGKAIVQYPGSPRPKLLTKAQFEVLRDGRIILMIKRAALTELTGRFDINWFMGAISRYRGLLGEVLLASFFLQIFALVSPLFFQVVTDKVLVHRSLGTLDVLVVGIVAISIFEVVLGGLRTYLFAHTTNRIDVELGARLFRHLLRRTEAEYRRGLFDELAKAEQKAAGRRTRSAVRRRRD